MKTLVVLSGGMDSVTVLHHYHSLGHEVEAISFDYGQRHSKELDCAAWQCEQLGIKHQVITLAFFPYVAGETTLIASNGKEVPDGHYEDENMKQTVVPYRNTILASIAASYASTIGAKTLALGIHQGDHAIYPDCRPDFLEALNACFNLGDWNPVQVEAPFIEMNKEDILTIGFTLDIDYSKTWTCYHGDDEPGYSGASVERAEAFFNLGEKDPTFTDEGWDKMVNYLQQLEKK